MKIDPASKKLREEVEESTVCNEEDTESQIQGGRGHTDSRTRKQAQK